MNFYAVVVVYNKFLDNSITVRSLLTFPDDDIHILIMDNSDNEYAEMNLEKSRQMHVQYYLMGGNLGLSKAYNAALNILQDKDKNDLVIWFDDDTPIQRDYFIALKKQSADIAIDVFVPVIYGQDGVIYSPNEVGVLKGKYIKRPDQKINKSRFNAINSCLAVRLRIYRDYRYDETIFMDCVDAKLFDDFRKKELIFSVLPITLVQNFFQRSDNADEVQYWNRFKIRIKDTLRYYSCGGRIRKICGILKVSGWAVMYGFKLRSWIFFSNCLKWMIINFKNKYED